MLKSKKIAIFASGSGSNAENIIRFFANNDCAKVELILCNNPRAYVFERAKNLGVESVLFSRDDFYKSDKIAEILAEKQIDLIVLAGFLWLVPQNIIDNFKNRIINIHPALLPKYGGKGMFGDNVHKAVIAAGEKESGITIHLVNEKYDDGDIIFQAKCEITASDTAETLAQKVHALEYQYFPKVINQWIVEQLTVDN
jgi:phosphoribosylglycinamide formyltransferase-1